MINKKCINLFPINRNYLDSLPNDIREDIIEIINEEYTANSDELTKLAKNIDSFMNNPEIGPNKKFHNEVVMFFQLSSRAGYKIIEYFNHIPDERKKELDNVFTWIESPWESKYDGIDLQGLMKHRLVELREIIDVKYKEQSSQKGKWDKKYKVRKQDHRWKSIDYYPVSNHFSEIYTEIFNRATMNHMIKEKEFAELLTFKGQRVKEAHHEVDISTKLDGDDFYFRTSCKIDWAGHLVMSLEKNNGVFDYNNVPLVDHLAVMDMVIDELTKNT